MTASKTPSNRVVGCGFFPVAVVGHEFMKQLKRGDASTSTTKIKIRHNILNAVEEALAGG